MFFHLTATSDRKKNQALNWTNNLSPFMSDLISKLVKNH